jgi:hypothetical protein
VNEQITPEGSCIRAYMELDSATMQLSSLRQTIDRFFCHYSAIPEGFEPSRYNASRMELAASEFFLALDHFEETLNLWLHQSEDDGTSTEQSPPSSTESDSPASSKPRDTVSFWPASPQDEYRDLSDSAATPFTGPD